MSIPVFWLVVAVLVALLYGIVLIADKIMQQGKKLNPVFVCDYCSYTDRCGSCKIMAEYILKQQREV